MTRAAAGAGCAALLGRTRRRVPGQQRGSRRRPGPAPGRPAASTSVTAACTPCGGWTSDSHPARSSPSWVATARGSPRCCGRCGRAARATAGDVRVGRRTRGGTTRPTSGEGARRRSRSSRRTRARPPLPRPPSMRSAADADDAQAGVPRRHARARPARSAPVPRADAHPRDLSEGQRLAPRAGGAARRRPAGPAAGRADAGPGLRGQGALAGVLAEHAARGGAVLLSSHDVEFVAECADRVVVLADGEVVADGPAREVLVAAPTLAPQVAKDPPPAPAADRRRRSARALAVPDERVEAGGTERARLPARPADRHGRPLGAGVALAVASSGSTFGWPLLTAPGRGLSHATHASAGPGRCARRRAAGGRGRALATAGSTSRPSRCSACCRPWARRCARSRPGRRASSWSSWWSCSAAGCSGRASASRSAPRRSSPRRC